MPEKTVYLDSSAIVKRYLAESGTETVDGLYHRAEAGGLVLAFSLWNVGEVLGAIARVQRRGVIATSDTEAAAWAFVRETLKIRGLGALRVVPVRGDLLARAVPLVFRYGVKQGDGLQIASSVALGATSFITADRLLLRAARAEGLAAMDPTADQHLIESL